MKQVLFATRNTGKLSEARSILADVGFQVISLDDTSISSDFDVEETGSSFEENAILKAKGFGEKTGLLTLADDSGLEVDALNGRPGVYSKRYGDDDQHRNQKLIAEMKQVPQVNRSARFVSVICVYDSKTNKTHCCEGEVKGQIAFEPKGTAGFGYDPIFIPNEGDGRTFAELGQEFKNKVSHRSRALRKIKILLM